MLGIASAMLVVDTVEMRSNRLRSRRRQRNVELG